VKTKKKGKKEDLPIGEKFMKERRIGDREWGQVLWPGRRKKVRYFDWGMLQTLDPDDMREGRDKIRNDIIQKTEASFDLRIKNLHPEEKLLYRQKRAEWVDKEIERRWKVYEKRETIIFQIYKMRFYTEEANRQRWKDAMVQWAFLWMKSSVEGASKGAKDFMSELEKIVMKMIS
jgi:hypothetical protein